jgi:gentisate 1,2-dioxygenase
VWHWRDLRPQAVRAAGLVGTEQAERRVLVLSNPGLARAASNTLVANIQIVMPGEIARAHRHTPAALRFIIEGHGGRTIVNGQSIAMAPGDLVLTPKWTWHDHANETDEPMIWLDGLDAPLVRVLEAAFFEQYPNDHQPAGALRPEPSARYSRKWHYPLTEALRQLDQSGADSPYDGRILEYTDPDSDRSVMPTIGCYLQRLEPGQHTRAHRHVCCTNYHVVEGEGYSLVAGERLEWRDKDVFTIPTWAIHEHVNTGTEPALLFSFTDAPAMKALDLYREEGVDSA